MIKRMSKLMFFKVRNFITLRPLRYWLRHLRLLKHMRPVIEELETQINSDNTVYIFQVQMFDSRGNQCFNGGAERYVTDLADVLVGCGYNPVLIQRGDADTGLWHKKIGNLNVYGLPFDDDYMIALPLLKRYKFVVYSGAIGWGKKLHPNIMISHGITWDSYNETTPAKIIKRIFDDVDKLVSVDTNTISWLRTTFPSDFKDFDAVYVPNYVDTNIYHPIQKKKGDKITITFPRRASPERGYWLMSAALPPILEKYKNIVFNFVGFAHGSSIQNDILRLETIYPGRISHCMVGPDEMPAIYQNTDISLIPTIYSEGTSLSCLEAMACGNVVIATNIGGLPNLVLDGFNGLLINPTGYDLMRALDTVLSDSNLQAKLSANAVNVAQAFDKTIWQKRWEQIVSNM